MYYILINIITVHSYTNVYFIIILHYCYIFHEINFRVHKHLSVGAIQIEIDQDTIAKVAIC